MQVVDIDDASVVLEPGERGELLFRGPLVMDGYYGNDEATRASIEPDGWLHSGDIATMDEDGYVTIVDRKTDMILTAGYNVYPAEIERVLCVHATVALAAVTGVTDEVKGELVVRRGFGLVGEGGSATADFGDDLAGGCVPHEGLGVVVPV
jgi:long-chain acyl-CoA synthetase